MANELQTIPLTNLALAFIPVVAVIFIMARWTLNAGTGVFALARMLVQLILIGYLLNWIFATESSVIVIAILCCMLLIASWIAMRPLQHRNKQDFLQALLAITLGGCLTLALIILLVLELDPWYAPRQVIPLAGMIFASAMNTISLTAERLEGELNRGTDKTMARQLAYKAGLIPLLNSLFAVGLVSLPGMMTGQILSGVSPLIAVRYQVVVMCMLTGASGISAAIYLTLALRHRFSN